MQNALTNPKQAYGDKKVPLHLIHSIALAHESAALHSGKLKYGENNYLETKVEIMTYIGAMLRHIQQYVSGERVDAKELVHHLGAVRACTNILLSGEATGMLIDNRPLRGRAQGKPVAYQHATANTFAEVEATLAHLNNLYGAKNGIDVPTTGVGQEGEQRTGDSLREHVQQLDRSGPRYGEPNQGTDKVQGSDGVAGQRSPIAALSDGTARLRRAPDLSQHDDRSWTAYIP